jgi:RecA-family ATPase
MQNPSFDSDTLSPTEFVDLCAEDDQRITEREFLDDARELAAKGLGKAKIVEALRSESLRSGGSVERLVAGQYRAAVNAAAQAIREVTEALGGRHEIEEPSALTVDEMRAARLSPECLVDGHLYCDVRIVAGAGGSGKSTLLLHEAACLAGGAPTLWGREIHRHGPVVYLTGEDSRETIAARLRCVIEDGGMLFSARRIAAHIFVADVSGAGFRLTAVANDAVVASDEVDLVITWLQAIRPVMVLIDPLASFSVGEARVNDSEQALIEAARRIRNACSCNVTLVHHVGKANAREKAVDQYAFRGGSALADGARMVNILTLLTPEEWLKATGIKLGEDEDGLRLALAKSTYKRRQPDLFIRRRGWVFQHLDPSQPVVNAEELRQASVLDVLRAEVGAGRFPTLRTTEGMVPGLSRAAVRAAIDRLVYEGLVERAPIPRKSGRGGAREYLSPRAAAAPPSLGIAAPVFGVPLRERHGSAANAAAAPTDRWCADEERRTNGAPTHQTEGLA